MSSSPNFHYAGLSKPATKLNFPFVD